MLLDGNLDGGLAQLGMMGKISTGSSALDLLLCMLLPALLKLVTNYIGNIDSVSHRVLGWLQLMRRRSGRLKCQRCITSEQTMNQDYGYWSNSSCTEGVHNHILQRALLLYINSLMDVAKDFYSADLMLHAPVTEVQTGRSVVDDDDAEADDEEKDEAARLSAYTVIASPPFGEWVSVLKREDGSLVEFMRTNKEPDENAGQGGGKIKSMTTHFHLRSTSHNSDPEELLSGFVTEAYQYYLSRLERQRKDCLFFYQPVYSSSQSSGGGGGRDGGASSANISYKRYALSGAKTFENGFFHPDKNSIMSLVDNFIAKKGKFAVSGFPHKLGLLLHGPPGTGKTSLIKALATYTKRHIISIPLNRIETNQELMDIIYDHHYRVQGQDLPVRLPFSKTIFVMEDVDAACDIVKQRDDDSDSSSSPTFGLVRGPVQGPAMKSEKDLLSTFKKWDLMADKLNLAGLLNVLDGVLDCPDRIVIMTTNHPEKLDPALIRPGRINKKIYMGYLEGREALEMVRHYFPTVSETESRSIRSSVSRCKVTPATLEMLCGEHETVSGLCQCLSSGSLAADEGTKQETAIADPPCTVVKAASTPLNSLSVAVSC